MRDTCKHKWAGLLVQYKKRVLSTDLAKICIKCGVFKIGTKTIRISRNRLDMDGKPIYNCSRGTGAGLRLLYAGDETEKTVSGAVETEIKFFRMVLNTVSGRNFTRLFFIGEAYVTGGTGYLQVSIDSAPSVAVWTFANLSYAPQQGFIDVSWSNNTIHTISVRLRNSGSFVTYNRTLEAYVE